MRKETWFMESAESVGRIKTAPASIAVFVDGICCDGGDVKGDFLHIFRDVEKPFGSLAGLLLALDCLMDDFGTPQRYLAQRTWEDPLALKSRHSILEDKKPLQTAPPIRRHGKVGTFILYILMRRNATWQGEVLWVEKKKRVIFRSALELLYLLETATAAESYEKMGRLEPEQTFFKP